MIVCSFNNMSRFGPRSFARTLEACQAIRQAMMELGAAVNLPNNIDSPSLPRPPQAHEISPKLPVTVAGPTLIDIATSKLDEKPSTSVLLVEDNTINLKLLVACVKKLNYDFLTAINGKEAVDAYASFKGKIPLVFMDIQMPIMDGTEAIRKIRQYEREQALPRSWIVALTALGSKEAKDIAIACGADMFLTKPVSLKTLTLLLLKFCEPPE